MTGILSFIVVYLLASHCFSHQQNVVSQWRQTVRVAPLKISRVAKYAAAYSG